MKTSSRINTFVKECLDNNPGMSMEDVAKEAKFQGIKLSYKGGWFKRAYQTYSKERASQPVNKIIQAMEHVKAATALIGRDGVDMLLNVVKG